LRSLNPSYLEEAKKQENSPVTLIEFYKRERKEEVLVESWTSADGYSWELSEIPIEDTIRILRNGIPRQHWEYVYPKTIRWEAIEVTENRVGELDITVRYGEILELGDKIEAKYTYEKIFRYAQAEVPIYIGSNRYEPIPFGVEDIGQDSKMSNSGVRIAISSVDLDFIKDVFSGDIRGNRLKIIKWFRGLNITDGYFSLDLFVSKSEINEDMLLIDCIFLLEAFDIKMPPRNLGPKCPWVFNSKECKYGSHSILPEADKPNYTSCPKSYHACFERKNIERFGGIPF